MKSIFEYSMEELKRGFTEDSECFYCIICNKKVEKGIIYSQNGTFYEAEKYIISHIKNEHKSTFDYLINLDKKYTGISEHQKRLLELFYQGKSDAEIQNVMGFGNASTTRNHRFTLKEKENQARIFLALMELLNEKSDNTYKKFSSEQASRKTKNKLSEENKIIEKYFPNGTNGQLKTFDMKETNRLIILGEIVKKFDKSKVYIEKEVNEILKNVYHDFSTLRRYLVDYGFLERKSDGSKYWVKEAINKKEIGKMDRKKELKQQYKEMKTEAGIYQIKNTKNNKAFVVSTPNLKTINGRKIELQMGSSRNKKLQEEWKEYGEESFVIEILEVLEEKDEPGFDKTKELKKLEEKWLEKLQPYGDKGYNR